MGHPDLEAVVQVPIQLHAANLTSKVQPMSILKRLSAPHFNRVAFSQTQLKYLSTPMEARVVALRKVVKTRVKVETSM